MSGLEGGCACGAVRYRLKSGPMFTNCCHCADCQRQVGSAFVINAIIETDRIEVLSGEIAPTAMPTDSGRPHLVYRCTACGTTLWSDYGDRKVMVFLRATTLDDRGALTSGRGRADRARGRATALARSRRALRRSRCRTSASCPRADD